MTTEKTNTDSQSDKVYTEEDMKIMRDKMIAFYEAELPFLKLQEEYERLQADVEDHKLRRLVCIQKQAYIYAQSDLAEEEARRKDDAKSSKVDNTGQAPAKTQDLSTPNQTVKRELKKN